MLTLSSKSSQGFLSFHWLLRQRNAEACCHGLLRSRSSSGGEVWSRYVILIETAPSWTYFSSQFQHPIPKEIRHTIWHSSTDYDRFRPFPILSCRTVSLLCLGPASSKPSLFSHQHWGHSLFFMSNMIIIVSMCKLATVLLSHLFFLNQISPCSAYSLESWCRRPFIS